MSEYPKMLYGDRGQTATVRSEDEEKARLKSGFRAKPSDEHRVPQRMFAPEPVNAPALTEAHLPALVEMIAEAVVERLKAEKA